MSTTQSSDKIFDLATDLVCNTSESIFLTGKAGTGKTTFLRHINKHSGKNTIVAAPTGIAAINAGGVTLHSLLQLPFEHFEPTFEGKKKLDFHLKLQKSKIELLRELDLLIIDEVSMLRADTLDAIDYILKRYRNNQAQFGGVQMLFIGDLFQLPPVVQKQEWDRLKMYYPSPFFYQAYALDDKKPLYIELKHVYRQTDQNFIEILNKVRCNSLNEKELDILNAKYNPDFQQTTDDRYVVLCTHNYKADKINATELLKIDTDEVVFEGDVKGDFNESSFPTDLSLTLKKDAQIMFVKNDTTEKRRYYNGKLGVISKLTKDKIYVCFDDNTEIEVEKETWRNIRYTLDEDSGDVEEKELGKYTQYPIRLAWAITIHKSQGLTFDRVIIDAGQAFAAGQVYVALSRCTSLDGIILHSKITASSIQTDQEAIDFAKNEMSENTLHKILEDRKPQYCAARLKKSFDWLPIVRTLHSFCVLVDDKKIPNKEDVKVLAYDIYHKGLEEQTIAQNFQKELDSILNNTNVDISFLQDRVSRAAIYFHKDLLEKIMNPLKYFIDSLKNASKVKQFQKRVKEIYISLAVLLLRLENIHYGDINLTKHLVFSSLESENVDNKEKESNITSRKKGDSKRLTLDLFNRGRSIEEIAKERNLAVSTVESHLTSFVLTGEVLAENLIAQDKLLLISSILEKDLNNIAIGVLKEQLPSTYSYFDIRVTINHLKFLNK